MTKTDASVVRIADVAASDGVEIVRGAHIMDDMAKVLAYSAAAAGFGAAAHRSAKADSSARCSSRC